MKLITIVGARPQFIKAAAISRAIHQSSNITEKIVHTGQHYDPNMSEIFFDEMDIPKPDYNLGVSNGGHGSMTGQMMINLEKIIQSERPDGVIVYGDTNSTLAGALVASKLHIPVIHIEAGLRSFNMSMPEEINRILCDRISTLLFCPTQTAINNLKNEGYDNLDCKIFLSGDVMYDTIIYYSSILKDKINLREKTNVKNNYILCTIHRAENTDDEYRLKQIFLALSIISDDIKVILPLHPRTKKLVQEYGIKYSDNLKIIDPVGYFDMLELLTNSSMVMTDSGGLQKEAFFMAKPCVTLRDQTEWVELLDFGYNTLSGANAEKIQHEYLKMKDVKIPDGHQLYGSGDAAGQIVKDINTYYAQMY